MVKRSSTGPLASLFGARAAFAAPLAAAPGCRSRSWPTPTARLTPADVRTWATALARGWRAGLDTASGRLATAAAPACAARWSLAIRG